MQYLSSLSRRGLRASSVFLWAGRVTAPRCSVEWMQRIRGKLTYANVIATLALFIALGGAGYAATQINGKNIKKRTIAGKRLKKNTLGGTEIKESKLGKVPSAANADTATNA